MVFGNLFGSKPKPAKRAKAKGGKHMAEKKKAFGGYAVSFKGQTATLEQVFGSKPIPPHEMTKKIWAFVKAKKLSTKG
jgi:chromatin remodeling complex protein RSC6